MLKSPTKKAANCDAGSRAQLIDRFLKDLCFEGQFCNAMNLQEFLPTVVVSTDIEHLQLEESYYELSLMVSFVAMQGSIIVFEGEIIYCGTFILAHMQSHHIEPTLMIECPTLLFPYLRNVLAKLTQAGGFLPLLLPLIDFEKRYQLMMNKDKSFF